MRNKITALTIMVLFGLAIGQIFADEAMSAAPAEGANVTEFKYDIPAIDPDTQIFRRTPTIDGVVDDGEWDAYYTFSVQGWNATTFADWDSNYLYAAVKSSRPLDFLVVVDCYNDGWFHGEDNFEFRTIRSSDESMNVAVSRYESRNTKLPIAVPVSSQDASMVEAKCSQSSGSYIIEMRVPVKLLNGFRPNVGNNIGLQLAVNAGSDETGWVPNNELGDTKECTLVSKKIASLKPLQLGFDLRDSVIARGDDIVAKFHLTNNGNETVDVKSFIIAGEGRSGKYLSSEMVRVDNLPPGKHIANEYRTKLLSGMSVGSWALGAEVKSGNGRLGSALVSFDVVEPFDIDLKLPNKDVRADVKDVTVGVKIHNNRREGISGVAKIVFPTGWEMWRDIDTRDFRAAARSDAGVSFKAKPPLGAIGDVPVKVVVECNGETKTTDGTIRIVNP